VRINGEMRCPWRAVDHEGEILESCVTKERDKAATLTFIKKALKRHGAPIVTDGLRSYRAASTEIGMADRQQTGRWLNNRVESSHWPFRRRQRAMARFRRMKTSQQFTSVHAALHNHFHQERPHQSRDLQAETLRRSGRVAIGARINPGRSWGWHASVESTSRWTDSTLPSYAGTPALEAT
jgi:putative transposase